MKAFDTLGIVDGLITFCLKIKEQSLSPRYLSLTLTNIRDLPNDSGDFLKV